MKMPMSHSFAWKFGIALVLIAVISLGLMGFSIYWSTTHQFESYIREVNTEYADRLAIVLSEFYTQENSWDDIQDKLEYFPHFKNDRIIISDNAGNIMGDSAGELLNHNITELDDIESTPIVISGEIIGELYILETHDGPDEKLMIPRQFHPGSPPPPEPEQRYLRSTINSLWIALGAAIVVAILLGLFLTRQITRPVHKLKEGTNRIASGDLSYRVTIDSKDEIGEMARSFNSMASSLEKAEQSRRQLNADIAHELRTPLTVIQGTVDGMLDGVFAADKEHLETIKHQAILLTRLTQDIRELSLAESGQLKLEPEPTDINSLVQRTINQTRTRAKDKNVDVIFNAGDNLPKIPIDPFRVSQAIANLITNALQHSAHDSMITISTSLLTDEDINPLGKSAICISVADSGKGIDAEHLPHVFQRFYRVDTSRARNDGGIGLGLAIVKQMVEAHEGKVQVDSTPGTGSTFSIFLPLAS